MGDFLRQLVESSWREQAPIQPRHPQPFENWPTDDPLWSEADARVPHQPQALEPGILPGPQLSKTAKIFDREGIQRQEPASATKISDLARSFEDRRPFQTESPELPILPPSFNRQSAEAEIASRATQTNRSILMRSNDQAHAAALTLDQTVTTPVVHVTIGRIEVRAVQPPAISGSVGSRTKPVVSLEDYLKSRGGG